MGGGAWGNDCFNLLGVEINPSGNLKKCPLPEMTCDIKVLDSVSSVADNILSAGDRAEETNEGYNVDLILDQTQVRFLLVPSST